MSFQSVSKLIISYSFLFAACSGGTFTLEVVNIVDAVDSFTVVSTTSNVIVVQFNNSMVSYNLTACYSNMLSTTCADQTQVGSNND